MAKTKQEAIDELVGKKSSPVDANGAPKSIFDTNSLRKKARLLNREYKTRDMFYRVIAVIILFFLICFGALYISRTLGGNFQINLSNGRRVISMCETSDFERPTDVLDAPIPAQMNNISYTSIPLEEILETDGSCNGKDYMAYSFYVKNTGNRVVSYYSKLKLVNFEKGLESCIRVMIIFNGEKKCYAKAMEGTEKEPELIYYFDTHALSTRDIDVYTIPFDNMTVGFNELRENLPIGSIDRYTVIVWIEGSDPETTDEKKSGIVKMGIEFEVLQEEDD